MICNHATCLLAQNHGGWYRNVILHHFSILLFEIGFVTDLEFTLSTRPGGPRDLPASAS